MAAVEGCFYLVYQKILLRDVAWRQGGMRLVEVEIRSAGGDYFSQTISSHLASGIDW
jgi:hypothetical protein